MIKTLTREDIKYGMQDKLGMTSKGCVKNIDAFFELIFSTLESGSNLKLSSFGEFNMIDKSARHGRNPKTLEPFPISARRTVTFKSTIKTKKFLNGELKNGSRDEKPSEKGNNNS